jgi:ribonuclease D
MQQNENRAGFERKMTKLEINRLVCRRYEGPIRLVRTLDELDSVIQRIQTENVLGFDTETRPCFRKGQDYLPSLLQLATTDAVYLFQLNHIGLPESLIQILESKDVVKTGVGLDNDIRQLKKMGVKNPVNFVDTGDLARKYGLHNHGLRGLTAVLLGFRISKGAQVTNWDRKELTGAQVKYAATDAWVSRELYFRIQQYIAESACPEQTVTICDSTVTEICSGGAGEEFERDVR